MTGGRDGHLSFGGDPAMAITFVRTTGMDSAHDGPNQLERLLLARDVPVIAQQKPVEYFAQEGGVAAIHEIAGNAEKVVAGDPCLAPPPARDGVLRAPDRTRDLLQM